MNHHPLLQSPVERDRFIDAVKSDEGFVASIADGAVPADLTWRHEEPGKPDWVWCDDDTAMVHGGWCLARCHAAGDDPNQ